MSNKKLTPKMWFKKEQQLKREFLEYLFNTGKLHFDGQQNFTLPKINNFPTPPTSELVNILSGYIIILEDFFGLPEAKLQPDEYQFEKLKNDYRSSLYTTNFIGPLSYQAFSFLKLRALS